MQIALAIIWRKRDRKNSAVNVEQNHMSLASLWSILWDAYVQVIVCIKNSWSCHRWNQTVDAAVSLCGITSVNLPLVSLAVQLVAASRQVFSFDNLETIQQLLLEGGSISDLLQTVIETLLVTAAQR